MNTRLFMEQGHGTHSSKQGHAKQMGSQPLPSFSQHPIPRKPLVPVARKKATLAAGVVDSTSPCRLIVVAL